MTDPSVPHHMRDVVATVCAQPIQPPPFPWYKVASYAVGGLLAVGYGDGSDLLLVLSTQGRGLFDCRVGTKIARDYNEAYDYFDDGTLLADGFDCLVGQQIHIAGLYGGKLPTSTPDEWHVEALPSPWPQHSILLAPPGHPWSTDATGVTRVGEDGTCELRAYGFSSTGQSFVIASSCELVIFARASQ